MYVMSGKCKKYLNMYVYIPSNCATERQRVRQQKRPTLEAKETYSGGKRDLLWSNCAIERHCKNYF